MRKIQIFLLILGLTLVASGSFAQAQKMSSVEEQLVANMNKAWDAFKNKDEKAFNALVADDCWEVAPNGSVYSKAQILENMRNSNITEFSLTDFKVLWIDQDAAILMYKASAKGTLRGKPIPEGQLTVSDVWVKKDGKWMDKHHQESGGMPMAEE